MLDAAAARAQDDPDAVLDEHPWLGAAIDDDAEAGRFAAWGSSTVIDENVGAPVLPRPLFDALHARAGLPAAWPVGNAGVLHVYGYLLSTTPTPYGLKRERWLGGELAGALGLPADAFVPWAHPRTLLQRVTEAAGALLENHAVRTVEAAQFTASVALHRVADAGPWALAYSVRGLLVTAFPVGAPDTVLAEWDAAPGRPRWNAVV